MGERMMMAMMMRYDVYHQSLHDACDHMEVVEIDDRLVR